MMSEIENTNAQADDQRDLRRKNKTRVYKGQLGHGSYSTR